MSHYRRIFIKGGTYFFTAVLENRQTDLLCRYINEFRQAYAETLSFYPFETIAICILPDHFHWVIRLPENDRIIPRFCIRLNLTLQKGCLKH